MRNTRKRVQPYEKDRVESYTTWGRVQGRAPLLVRDQEMLTITKRGQNEGVLELWVEAVPPLKERELFLRETWKE